MKFSYPASHRLKTPKDFNYLREKPNKVTSPYFILYYKPSRIEAKNSRLGISVTKKSANAVGRNKFKRLFREAFRLSKIRRAGLDLMVVVSKKSVNKDFHKNKENMQRFKVAFAQSLDKIA